MAIKIISVGLFVVLSALNCLPLKNKHKYGENSDYYPW